MDREFNLLDEPWIRVMLPDFTQKELSLTDVLLKAHEIRDLAGELPAQDTAVLRLLLAVLHTVFSRSDENGDAYEIEEPDEALRRWGALWNEGSFPEIPVRRYLEEQHDRFWLFDPERPFFQVPGIAGTDYTAAKLNGALSESNNKTRLFPPCAGEGKAALSYAEAARWLLFINGYDDSSGKPTSANKSSSEQQLAANVSKNDKNENLGTGWLGKIGAVCAVGENLFETLMLNLVLLRDRHSCWEEGCPVWERETPKAGERTEIPLPNNQPELLTLQSRRLLLKREDGAVTGYTLLGGDFFQRENAFTEQMTVWRTVTDKNKKITGFHPKMHDKSRQMWRDFAAFAAHGEGKKRPGIVDWAAILKEGGLLPDDRLLRLRITGVQYGDKNSSIADEFSDSMEFNAGLLTEAGDVWQELALIEIELCGKIAQKVGQLADDLEKASGGGSAANHAKKRTKKDTIEHARKHAMEQFYYRLDMPFREWLRTLDPGQGTPAREERRKAWRSKVKTVAEKLGKEYAEQAGEVAFTGRTLTENGKERRYSAPEAFNFFRSDLNKIINGRDAEQ